MDRVATNAGTASGLTQEGPEGDGHRETEALKGALVVDTDKVRGHLDEVVRSTVEETLNAMLDAEADRVAGAGKYERSADRQDTRAGSYQRKLQTKAGEVTLKVPRLRKLPLETAIIERYKRRESSVEEALIEMYLAGVRRVAGTPANFAQNRATELQALLDPRPPASIDRAWRSVADWRARPLDVNPSARRQCPKPASRVLQPPINS